MRFGFTLVEVVAAAAIASLAGLALLQMNSQSTFLFGRLSNTSAVAETLSLVGNHADTRFMRTTKSLYDILDGTYNIENDEFRRFLQNEKYEYDEKRIATAGFDSSGMPKIGETVSGAQLENAAAVPVIQFELIQLTIRKEDLHGSILTVRPL